MTSGSDSDHGNPAEIAVSEQKGSSSKGWGTNRNFGKCKATADEFRELLGNTSCHLHLV